MRRLCVFCVSVFSVSILAIFMSSLRIQASPASTFVVNNTDDMVDVNPGDGVCETAVANNVCTVRAAIQESNALAGADIINIPSGTYTLTIVGEDSHAAMGDLNITDTLTILGANSHSTIVNANGIDQVFDIRMSPGKEVTISDLSIINGTSNNFGGGICLCASDISLYLNQVIVRDNQNFISGGGVYNYQGYTEIMSSTIEGNIGGSSGGGFLNTGTALVFNTIISGNMAPYDGLGGGIYNSGDLIVENSTIHRNSVAASSMGSNGGGIFNSVGASVTVKNSTISQNTAQPSYGGFVNYGGTASLINVTVSGNSQGGILQFNGGATYITNTSVISNIISLPWSVNLRQSDGYVYINNSIVANNDTDDNCVGSILSLGNNLDSTNSCGFSNTGDITQTNPLVGPLQGNGGETFTHALLAGSPAIDAGSNSTCPATDQRGVIRPIDGNDDTIAVCDMGAYEFSLTQAIVLAVDDQATTTPNTAVLIDVLANDTPGEGGVLNLSTVGTPMSGTAVISGTTILYTPTLGFTGTDTFTYTITDGFSEDTAVVTVTVKNLNIFLPVILKNE